MAATCFPYGFPTSHSRVEPSHGQPWPRCVNAEPGTFGHECGKPAVFIGTNTISGTQGCFCAACKEIGYDASPYGQWQELPSIGPRQDCDTDPR